jgi:hypothetical protein
MKYNAAEIEEARRLAQQAEGQIAAQIEMIDRMRRSGLSTAVAEEALRMMRKLHVDLMTRLSGMLMRDGWLIGSRSFVKSDGPLLQGKPLLVLQHGTPSFVRT